MAGHGIALCARVCLRLSVSLGIPAAAAAAAAAGRTEESFCILFCDWWGGGWQTLKRTVVGAGGRCRGGG